MGNVGGNHAIKQVILPPIYFCKMHFLCSRFWDDLLAQWPRNQLGETGPL